MTKRRLLIGLAIVLGLFILCCLGSLIKGSNKSKTPRDNIQLYSSSTPSTTTTTIEPIVETVAPTTVAPTTTPPKPIPTTTTQQSVPNQPTNVYYANCAAVRKAGKAPLLRGQPGYSSDLDRDGDGRACEK